MKLKSVHIERFKGVEDVLLDFSQTNSAAPASLHVVVGDNGTGKTTVLQAIALVLSLATKKTRRIEDFAWYGFLPERIGTLGKTRIELEVLFDAEEVSLTKTLFQDWKRHLPVAFVESHRLQEPSSLTSVTLVYENGELKAKEGFPALVQFLGRYYIKSMIHSAPQWRESFPKLGDVFWFDQYRNLGTAGFRQATSGDNGESAEEKAESAEPQTWTLGLEKLREALVVMWSYHVMPRGRNYIPELQDKFAILFPGTTFIGTAEMENAPAPRAKSSYFLLQREGRVFDLAEMSSGEQGVFALIYDFVRLSIQRSVVLVDELELHLHPPEQQTLLTALRRLGPDCQFLITTHSSFVEGSIATERKTRLPGGRPCL